MNISFIGCGNMGSAIIKGILTSPAAEKYNISVFDSYAPAMDKLAAQFSVEKCSNAAEAAKKGDVVFLAVKPNVLSSVLSEIDNSLENTLVVSIAAGKSTDFIASCLTHKCKIIRVMPNINAVVGEAISAVCKNSEADENDENTVVELMECTGKVLKLDESAFPLFGVLGGCSPAFVYMFIDALARAGVKNGMKKADALSIAAQSVYGSAKMIMESDKHPWELVDNVCSPGGTTIEGVLSLKEDGFESAIQNAVDAAVEKDSKL